MMSDDINETNSISIVWCVDDIRHLGFQCTDEEGMSVLQSVEQEHDATMGVNWDTLDFWAHEHGLTWVDPLEDPELDGLNKDLGGE